MANTILLKRSDVANSVPAAGNLVPGELALNFTDGNLFFKDSSNEIVLLTSSQFVDVSGNVSGNFILGNGSQLTGINAFSTISIAGQSNVVADSISDTLTFAAGSGIALLTDAANDVITIATVGTGDSIFLTGGSMGTVEEAITSEEDLGLIVDSVIEAYDLGSIVTGGLIYPSQLFIENIEDFFILGGEPGQYLGTSGDGVMVWQTLDQAPLQGTMVGNILGNTFSIVDVASLSATGNITAANFIGDGSQLTGLPAGYTDSDVANLLSSFGSNSISTTGNISGGNISGGNISGTNLTGTIATAAQPNITSVGTLTSLSVTGNISGGNLITAGLVSLSSITKSGSNGVGNIGSATNTFDTVFARATSALYADVAENYLADANYEPGTVLIFGGTQEVTMSEHESDTRIAGVVSTQPSYIMNSGLVGQHVVTVALLGRVPCRVLGPISKGNMLVSTCDGYAMASSNPKMGTVIGKALENFNGTEGVIEIVVGIR